MTHDCWQRWLRRRAPALGTQRMIECGGGSVHQAEYDGGARPPSSCLGSTGRAAQGGWLDPATGQIELSGAAVDGGLSPEELKERGAVQVATVDSRRGYRDMQDFIATLEDDRARATLLRAIERNRPFHRFKEAVYRDPEIGRAWSDFHDQRMRHHAITWLLAEGLINEQEARDALPEDPPIE